MIRNTAFMAVSTAFRLAGNIVLFVILARILSVEDFGLVVYAFAVGRSIALIIDYGFNIKIVRDLNATIEPPATVITRLQDAKHITCVISIPVVVLAALVLFSSPDRAIFLSCLMAAVANSYTEFYAAALRGLNKFYKETQLMLYGNILVFVLVVGVATLTPHGTAVGIAFCVARIIQLFIGHFMLWRLFRESGRAMFSSSRRRLADAGKELRDSIFFACDTMFSNFYLQYDTILVKFLLGVHAVGIYQAGMKIVQGASLVAQIVTNVYLPELAKALEHQDRLRALSVRVYTLMLLSFAPFGILMFIFQDTFVNTVFGPRYSALVPLMPLFGALILVRFHAAAFGLTMIAIGRQSSRVFGIVLSFGILTLGSLLLSSTIGLRGIAIASIGAIVSLNIVYISSLARAGALRPSNKFDGGASSGT